MLIFGILRQLTVLNEVRKHCIVRSKKVFAAFTRTRHCTYPEPAESRFYFRLILILSSRLCLGHSSGQVAFSVHISRLRAVPICLLHVLPSNSLFSQCNNILRREQSAKLLTAQLSMSHALRGIS
jgi:hypothetical protein